MRRLIVGAIALTLVAALSPAGAGGVRSAQGDALLSLTVSGPATFVPHAQTMFTGLLESAAGHVGIPLQSVDILIDGGGSGSEITQLDGTFARTAVFDDFDSHSLQAVAYAGTPLEIRSNVHTVDVARVALTVTLTGRGNGTVGSSPPGIDCGVDCTADYPVTESVTLTASPNGVSQFAGWSGACSGSLATCTVSMNEAKGVTARFDLIPSRMITGLYWSCGLFASGTAKCWGLNGSGQLGDGTTTDRATPVEVAGLSDIVEMSAGFDHTCALMSNGTVRCWGGNARGQLGDGTTIGRTTPAPVPGITNAVSIGTGYDTSCAVLSTGSVRCWGLNQSGQLGDGTSSNIRTLPVSVMNLSNAVMVAGGSDHFCALRDTGKVVCWGTNSLGQLGDMQTQSTNKPATEVVDIADATHISVERQHGCALLRDLSVRCWGSNAFGQLGDGTTTTRRSAVVAAGLGTVMLVSAGYDFTCALLTDATQRCWGWNAFGQLGNGTQTSSTTPVVVSGLSSVRAPSAGGLHSCSLLQSGEARCWGYNGYGQVGDGTDQLRKTPVPVIGFP